MANIHSIICDQCGKIRNGDASKWLLTYRTEYAISFRAWNYEDAESLGHLCGKDCMKEMAGQYYEGWQGQQQQGSESTEL